MKFIHFGCWNNGKCEKDGNNGLSKMSKLLENIISEETINFITLAGDNYYPTKNPINK